MQNQMLARASAPYGKAGPSAAADGDWNDDTLVVGDGLRDSKGVALNAARSIRRSTLSNDSSRDSRGEIASASSTSDGGSFFVPLANVPNFAIAGYIPAAGGISRVTYAGGSVVNSTSSGTALAALSVVSP